MITKKQAELLIELINADWVEDHVDDAADYIIQLAKDVLSAYDEIELLKELIQPYHDIMISLNKENKKLHTKLSKYEK